MKLFASSNPGLDVGFLHAGYMSAYPNPYNAWCFSDDEPTLKLDLVEALRLKSEVAVNATTDPSTAGLLGGHGGPPSLWLMALALFGIAALLYVTRRYWQGSWGRLVPIAAPLLLVLGMVHCQPPDGGGGENDPTDTTSDSSSDTGLPPLPTTIPWEGVERQEYADPAAATFAILHGIIAPAIGALQQSASSLPNIQDEVGLPTTNPAPGMQYALQTYGLDGWGREFAFEKTINSNGSYGVTSAGPDGKMDTADDLSITASSMLNHSRSDCGNDTFYLRRNGEAPVLFLHRWAEEMMYNDAALAETLTGSQLFDVVPLEHDQPTFNGYLAEFEGDEDGHEPLVMLVYPPPR